MTPFRDVPGVLPLSEPLAPMQCKVFESFTRGCGEWVCSTVHHNNASACHLFPTRGAFYLTANSNCMEEIRTETRDGQHWLQRRVLDPGDQWALDDALAFMQEHIDGAH